MSRPQNAKIDLERRIGQLRVQARSWLSHAKLSSAPIDLLALAPDRKLVDIRAKDLRGECDGLLRWVEPKQRFYLYYDDSSGNSGKTRFNLAHELSHLFIDEHCTAIRRGDGTHQSSAGGFIGNRMMEREADIAASELLIPAFLMPASDPTIEAAKSVSNQFDCSMTSAAWAIVDRTSVPAAVILSLNGSVLWCRCNLAMIQECGTWGINAERTVPENTPTNRSSTTFGTTITGRSDGSAWFTQGHHQFWEEAFTPFGGRLTLTLMSG